jgi:hypothetical protein
VEREEQDASHGLRQHLVSPDSSSEGLSKGENNFAIFDERLEAMKATERRLRASNINRKLKDVI